MYLLFAIWRPRLLRLVRGFRFFWGKHFQNNILYFLKVLLGHLSHSSVQSLHAQGSYLSEINCSLKISDYIRNPKWMYFFTRGKWSSKKYILTEFSKHQYWSLKIFMLSILLISDIFSKWAPPNISFAEFWFFLMIKILWFKIYFRCMPVFIIFHSKYLWVSYAYSRKDY